jgi:hypothetical protein
VTASFAGATSEVDAALVAAQATDIARRIEHDGLPSVPEDALRLRLR